MESLSFEQVQIILLANSDKKKIPSPSSSVKHLKTLRVKAKVNLRTWIKHGVPERAWIHMLRSKTSLIHEYSLQKQKVIVPVIPPTSSRGDFSLYNSTTLTHIYNQCFVVFSVWIKRGSQKYITWVYVGK